MRPQDELFCEQYILTRDAAKAVREAGIKTNRPGKYGRDLLNKPDVVEYLKARWKEIKGTIIADQTEVLLFLSDTIRNDHYKISDRLKAAEIMAKIYKLFDDNLAADRPQIVINTQSMPLLTPGNVIEHES